jgi:hypothetical protein
MQFWDVQFWDAQLWHFGLGVWGTEDMKNAELIDSGWPGPRDEMDRARHCFHCFGNCSECHEIICVEKALTDGPSALRQTGLWHTLS